MKKSLQFKNFNQLTKKLKIFNPNIYIKLIPFWKKQNINYFITAEEISKQIFYLEKKWRLKKYYSLGSYNSLCKETIQEQFFLKKTGTYRSIKEKKNNTFLYSSNKKMQIYLLGLLLTQILWPSHYKILNFYRKKIKKKKNIKFLEIGAGHGLMSKYLIEESQSNNGTICDISKKSLELVKEILKKKLKLNRQIEFRRNDFFKLKISTKFDFIIMGEVVEHVTNPVKFILKAKKLLQKNGIIFLSTCANCAQVDHLYHFKSIKEIKSLIKKCKLKIISELISPSENINKKNWKKEKIAINYCAFLKNEKN